MDVFEFCMGMERDGEQYYRKLAGEAADPGLQRIFTLLADDEVKHFQIFQALAASGAPEMATTTVLTHAKNVFQEMRDAGTTSLAYGEPHAAAYREAQQVEARSRDFYREQAAAVPAGPARELLLRIADEEQRHHELLGHLLQFVQRPSTWIENAEFRQIEEY
ncbi:MAG: ferritin family protein [Myxococcota bacterium]|jgi:rubrerythrin|nr:ferritin family protein [Myxococcota bacterium]